MKKKILLFTDGFPWDPGETPFIYNELCVMAKSFDIDIVASVRKQHANRNVCIELPKNVRLHKYVIDDIGRKEKMAAALRIVGSKAWKSETAELKGNRQRSRHISEAYTYITRAGIFLKWLVGEVEPELFDVCYTYWNSYATLALAIYREKHPGLKLITRTHGYDLYNERMILGKQYFKKYADCHLEKVLFIADTGKKYYLDNFATASDDTKYIVNPIGVVRAGNIPVREKDSTFTLVSCSSVIPLKRVEMIAEALAGTEGRIHWIHFGGGSEFDNLKSLCERLLDGHSNITYELKGQLPNSEVRRFYDAQYVDCFITTSSTEGSPVSIQEALAYGITVIGTDVGEISKLIDGCGVLLKADPTVDEVKEAIQTVVSMNEESTEKARKTAYERWSGLYDSDNNADKFVKLLEEI